MSEQVKYYRVVGVHDGGQFRDTLKQILNDSRGWKQYNIRFVDVGDSSVEDCVSVRLDDSEFVYSNDNERQLSRLQLKLSYYDKSNNQILLDRGNWFDPKLWMEWVGEFGLEGDRALKSFREYVVNHEFGHYAGFIHPDGCNFVKLAQEWGVKKCSIMCQQTLGRYMHDPFEPNSWPLPHPLELLITESGHRNNTTRLSQFYDQQMVGGGCVTAGVARWKILNRVLFIVLLFIFIIHWCQSYCEKKIIQHQEYL